MLPPSTPLPHANAPPHPVIFPSMSAAHRVVESKNAAEWETLFLASTIELQSQLDRRETLEDAAHHTAHRMTEMLGATRIIIAWQNAENGSRSARLRRIADTDGQTQQSEGLGCRLEMAAAEEATMLGGVIIWPPSDDPRMPASDGDRVGCMAIGQLARHLGAASIHCVGLQDDQESEARGCAIAINAKTTSGPAILRVLASPLASKFSAVQRGELGPVASLLRHVGRTATEKKWRWIGLLVLAFVPVMFFPVHYTIRANVEVQPVQRRYIAVPFDGPLDQCLVRAGDLVAQTSCWRQSIHERSRMSWPALKRN